MLIIKSKGGLGNRMLSAATAIAYAQATKREWCIDWCDGIYAPAGVNAISELFQISEDNVFDETSKYDVVTPLVWVGRLNWAVRDVIAQDYPTQHSDPLIYRKLSAALVSIPLKKQAEIFWSYTSKFGRIKRYLSKEQKKLGRKNVLGHMLKTYLAPNDRIASTVNTLLKGDASRTLGVHIRYTDLKIPIDKLIARVESEVQRFQYKTIFLATDSQYAETLFNKTFSNVITQNRRYSDGNGQLHSTRDYSEKRQDAEVALIDMYTLSGCQGLVYCSRSTFSETSRILGEFDKGRVIDVDRYNVVIQIKKLLQEYL